MFALFSNFSKVQVPGVDQSYGNQWNKTRAGVWYAGSQVIDDYDWFMKADDDTYVVPDNARYLLRNYSATEQPLWAGFHFKVIVKTGCA